MKATVFRGEEDMRVEEVEKPEVKGPEEALIRVTHTCICGSDLWHYRGYSEEPDEDGERIGHEPMGVVEEVGEDVVSLELGDRVLAPFSISCGECEFCRKGLYTSCENGDSWNGENGGAQGEYVKCPYADGTLVKVPEKYEDNEEILEKLLPLTDVMCTGHHAAVCSRVGAGDTCIVIGDGAVGLCGVLAAQRLGAEKIIAMGHHEDRLELAEEFGATHTISSRGDEAVEKALGLTGGGSNHVLECVGSSSSMNMAARVARPGGTVGYVGVPYDVDELDLFEYFGDNIELRGGVAPVRKYIEDLMEDVLQGNLDPSPIFTKEVDLNGVPEGYEAMDNREAIKVLVRPQQK